VKVAVEISALDAGHVGINRWIPLMLSSMTEHGVHVSRIAMPGPFKRLGGLGKYIYFNLYIPALLAFRYSDYDLFIIPNNLSKFLVCPSRKSIYFIHDLIPLEGADHSSSIKRALLKLKYRQIRSARAIFTTTVFVRKQIVRRLDPRSPIYELLGFVDRSLHEVTLPAADECVSLPNPFLLCIGTGEPRKNIDVILHAYALDRDRRLPRLLAFGKSWNNTGHAHILERCRQYRISDRICLLGPVSDGQLALLYGKCLFFIYPSLAEGFGLPPIEAMQFGKRVLVSDLEVFREVLGDSAHYVPTNDPAKMYQALLEMCNTEPALPQQSIDLVYSPAAAARRFLAALRSSITAVP
jgi:glycosyltransferase involved in cell wall biosynthesis